MGAVLTAALTVAFAGPVAASPCDDAQDPKAAQTRASERLEITFFGVSTLLFSTGTEQILVDGYFSRPTALATIFGRIGPREAQIEPRMNDARIERLRAIIVAHGHHDHALDAAAIAVLTQEAHGARAKSDALVIGTGSTITLMRANGVEAGRTCPVKDGGAYTVGSFKVTPYRADHGPSRWILRALLTGTIAPTQGFPDRFYAFKDTENLSYLIEYGDRRILVHPSAGMGTAASPKAELVFFGIGGLGVAPKAYGRAYWRQIQRDTGAQTFVPIHWDRFTVPLESGFSYTPWPFDLAGPTFKILEHGKAASSSICFMGPRQRLVLPARGSLPPVRALEGGDRRLSARPACQVGAKTS